MVQLGSSAVSKSKIQVKNPSQNPSQNPSHQQRPAVTRNDDPARPSLFLRSRSNQPTFRNVRSSVRPIVHLPKADIGALCRIQSPDSSVTPMSALTPKANMRSALAHVCFGP